MSIIKADNPIYSGLKSVYLNNRLKLRNEHGKPFAHIVQNGTVKTSCGHTLWFAEVDGDLNKYFREDGIYHIREKNKHAKWRDYTDNAAEKFANGENVIRSVIRRWVKSNDNHYYGEFQLVEINDEFRIWKRIASEVEMETFA